MRKPATRVFNLLLPPLLLMTGLASVSFAQQTTPVFSPGNLVVAVSGCATVGGTCTTNATPGVSGSINGPAGGYGDDQGAPWSLFVYSVNGASSATYQNSVVLPQSQSGTNMPVSNDYGSLSEGTLQLSGDGRFLTMYGFGLNAATFNANYLNYCPGNSGTLASSCVPENGNPAMAQTGSLAGQTYTGNIPVPRVAALIDPYGNANTSTVLYNIHNQNDARSAYSVNGSSIYVSGQGCKTWDPSDMLCDGGSTSPFDDTMGIYLTPVGATNDNPTPITGPDNGPTGCNSLTTCDSSVDTRMITAYGGTLYVSLDAKPGSSTGGYNRSYVGSLGATGSTSVFTCAGVGAGCPTGDGPYGPALLPGFGNTGGTGKYTLNTAGSGNTSNGNNLSVGLAVNLSPQNFFFASPTVLYVADTGFPKNTSNGPDAVCTTDGGKSTATTGNGGLQKWVLNPTVTATVTSGSTTVSASSGAFTQGQVGLVITGTGIPAGDTIKSVSSAGANVTLTTAATGSGTSVSIAGWSLAYTLYNGLSLALNSDCNPATPIGPGGNASTGLYGVTGVVKNGVATLYVTSYPNNDLINSYLYGITDTLATTVMTSPGTAFTQLAVAPSDSVFRGVSMAPTLPSGSETITSTPSGLTFTTSGTGCQAGTYTTPTTLTWTSGKTCNLSTTASQTISGAPVNPVSTTYNFKSWQDGTTNASSDNVVASATTGTYNIAFQTVPTVVFPTASTITYGQALSASTLSGGSATVALSGAVVSGSFAFVSPNTVPAAGTAAQNVIFTPTDTTHYASVTGTVNVTVNMATPTAVAANKTVAYGSTVTLSATDTGVTGGVAPTGTASFTVNGTAVSGTPSCSASGVVETCTLNYTSSLAPGMYSIVASFAADLNYTMATSAAATLTVGQPTITFSSVGHNFGSIADGTSTTVANGTSYGVKLTNNSSSTVTGSVVLSGSSEFSEADNCKGSVAAGASCELIFTFSPTAAGVVQATWSVTGLPGSATFSPSNGGTLTGTGIASSNGVTISTGKHNYGTQKVGTTSAVFGATLTNSTTSTVTISVAAPTGNTSSFITTANNCGTSLLAGQSCQLQYEFNPQVTGSLSEFIGITSPAGVTVYGSPYTGLTLVGTGQ